MFILPISSDLHLELLDQPRAEELFRLVRANSEHLAPWMPWVPLTQSVDDTRRFIGEGQRLWAERRSCRCGIVESGCLVGVIDLHDFTEDSRSASIGYWLAASAQGRGLLARALGKTIELGFLGYDRQRLVIRCSTENLRSQRAAERQGFRRDGVIRAKEIIAGRAHGHAIYTLLRSEWHAAHA
ncbi:GNAT family N-acetyltransferase [Pseudomonas aeruginosa]|uniref:GNAT family N-acetyltransferase n=1 Tax=Pseudomonas aeruginosa TaxID=287 RepID=UPI00053E6675|nr:GNAT family protein [Pseudomonas aeruginosa]KSD06211.1 ribosomal-protein-serine acetyltransferase [Pseudomonas aeruginosa]MCS8198644.1 GNAT family N-acetyltransferase [Pseudomonas aeruginosa]MCS8438309.1 GNAT family N-acetyltransferase [Pseudomonas aeruginosa]MDG3925976.1 GNAT family N-acetyltransferase [Pseudomonas aeruginosa]MDG4014533.1 GNAT family N-acetyltransferase [Pseudomonas aeruginosa]